MHKSNDNVMRTDRADCEQLRHRLIMIGFHHIVLAFLVLSSVASADWQVIRHAVVSKQQLAKSAPVTSSWEACRALCAADESCTSFNWVELPDACRAPGGVCHCCLNSHLL